MVPRNSGVDLTRFFRAASLADLRGKGMLTVPGADRPILLCWYDGKVFALDNRCPHMGFPLSRGSLEDGMLTCHWHHARFELRSGCTFDLWADDVPAFEVRLEGDDVWVSRQPTQRIDAKSYAARLRRGMEQNVALIQAKSIISLLTDDEALRRVIREIARFGAQNHQVWADGMTTLSIVARLGGHLRERTLVYALAAAARSVAENCAGQPARRSPGSLNGERFDENRLGSWMFHWAKIRHNAGTERTLLTAVDSGLSVEAFNRLVFGPMQERIYADGGHALDLTNKAFELLDVIDWDSASELLPLVVEHLAQSQSEEERGTWRAPIDLVELIREAEHELWESPSRLGALCSPDFYKLILTEDPEKIIGGVSGALSEGVPGAEIARHLALAASWRLACFPESNDIDDWFAPMHTFSFCNALHRVLARGEPGPELVRGLFHGAMSIYVDRFLNIPGAPLPAEQSLENLPTMPNELLSAMLAALEKRAGWSELPRLAVRYLRLGFSEAELIDTLVYATVREDLDFHHLQVLEAGITQAAEWPPDSAERELIYTAIARNLNAHCPTRRSSSQSVGVALRLHKGEEMYSREAPKSLFST